MNRFFLVVFSFVILSISLISHVSAVECGTTVGTYFTTTNLVNNNISEVCNHPVWDSNGYYNFTGKEYISTKNVLINNSYGNNTICYWGYNLPSSNAVRMAISGLYGDTGGSVSGSLGISGGYKNYYFMQNSSGTAQFLQGTVIPNNTWFFSCGTWNSTWMQLYYNGVADGGVTMIGNMTLGTSFTHIGHDIQNAYFWNGSIDDVRVYNRALNITEIIQLNNSVRGISNISNGLVYFANFNSLGETHGYVSGFSTVNMTWLVNNVSDVRRINQSGTKFNFNTPTFFDGYGNGLVSNNETWIMNSNSSLVSNVQSSSIYNLTAYSWDGSKYINYSTADSQGRPYLYFESTNGLNLSYSNISYLGDLKREFHYGFTCYVCYNSMWKNNYFDSMSKSPYFYVRNDNSTFKNNFITGTVGNMTSSGFGFGVTTSYNVIVDNNTIFNLTSPSGWKADDSAGIFVDGASDNVTVSNNIINYSETGIAVWNLNRNILVIANIISHVFGSGVKAENPNVNITFDSNIIDDCGIGGYATPPNLNGYFTKVGIEMESHHIGLLGNILVKNNKVSNCESYFSSQDGTNITVINNTFLSSTNRTIGIMTSYGYFGGINLFWIENNTGFIFQNNQIETNFNKNSFFLVNNINQSISGLTEIGSKTNFLLSNDTYYPLNQPQNLSLTGAFNKPLYIFSFGNITKHFFSGLISALLTNGTSLCNGSSSNLALNTGQVNITLLPSGSCYVLDSFNLTEGVTRENSPLAFGTNTNTEKHVTSTLDTSINLSITLNADCNTIGRITYISDLGFNQTWNSGDYTCSNGQITFNNIPIDPSLTSNIFTLEYNQQIQGICNEGGLTFYGAVSIVGVLLTIFIIGLVLAILVLSFRGTIDIGNIRKNIDFKDFLIGIMTIMFTFLLLVTIAFIFNGFVCSALGG